MRKVEGAPRGAAFKLPAPIDSSFQIWTNPSRMRQSAARVRMSTCGRPPSSSFRIISIAIYQVSLWVSHVHALLYGIGAHRIVGAAVGEPTQHEKMVCSQVLPNLGAPFAKQFKRR